MAKGRTPSVHKGNHKYLNLDSQSASPNYIYYWVVCRLVLPGAHGDVIKLLILSNQHFKIQRKAANAHVWEAPHPPPVHKASFIKELVFPVWCGRTGLSCTKPWPQPHQAPLGWTGSPTPSQGLSTSVGDPSNTLVAEWEQIRTARFQNLARQSLTQWVEVVVEAD